MDVKKNYYSSSPQNDPLGPSTGADRIQGGGSWNINAEGCRVANRSSNNPINTLNYYGFRIAR